jgi:hypothetical protein
MSRPPHPPRLYNSNYTSRRVQIMKLLVMQLSPPSGHSIPLWSKYSPQHPVLKGISHWVRASTGAHFNKCPCVRKVWPLCRHEGRTSGFCRIRARTATVRRMGMCYVCGYIGLVRFEVFAAVTMKNGVLWDVTPYGSCKNRHFGGT